MSRPLVIGIGSHHGDDQAGWLIVDCLETLGYPRTRLYRALHPADLLDHLDPAQSLLVCDACQGASPVGTIQCLCWPNDSLETFCSRTTHDMSLPTVLDLAGRLRQCPTTVKIWSIAGREWSPGSLPGNEVRASAREVAETIWRQHHNA